MIAFTWTIGQYVYSNHLPVYYLKNFGINLSFLIKPFSYMNKKEHKFKNLTKKQSFLNEKEFFIIFKGLSLTQMKQTFLEGESLTLKGYFWYCYLSQYPKCDKASNLWFQLELAFELVCEALWTGAGTGLLF